MPPITNRYYVRLQVLATIKVITKQYTWAITYYKYMHIHMVEWQQKHD